MMRFTIIALLFAFLSIESAQANERRFSNVYESGVLPKGAREIEIWNTYRTGRNYYYRRFDQRIEYEFGITDNFMGALYLNNSYKLFDTKKGEPGGTLATESSPSISGEWKYKLLDPVANPVGMALYAELTLGLNKTEIEGKIILDKKVGDFLFAFNGVYEAETKSNIKDGSTISETEITPQICFGATYFITPHFTAGVEAKNHNEIVDGVMEHSAVFFGPSLSYSAEEWWTVLTVMPQVANLHGHGGLDLDEHEKIEARLLFAFHL